MTAYFDNSLFNVGVFSASSVGLNLLRWRLISAAIDTYLMMSSEAYETLLRQMPEKQRNVFLAIAAEGHVKSISGGKFVHKYRLPSVSSVVSAVKGLLEKDFITETNGEYYVYDQFFLLWLQRRAII